MSETENSEQHALCHGCGENQRLTQQSSPKFPDGGWAMEFEHFGYYGGFSDDIDVAFGKRKSGSWSLCHDCVVRFFDAFPLLAEKFGQGHHPNFVHTDLPNGERGTSNVSCCRFAWTWNVYEMNGKRCYDTYYGDGNGGWVLHHNDVPS